MGRNNYFQFKQFRIVQEKSAMKVGTDGVLVGAWADFDGAKTVLDVGAGTGLISLIAAQRSSAIITGIEIEANAVKEANANVSNSPWNNRVTITNTSFQDFVNNCNTKFDCVISNPPFFSNGTQSKKPNQSIARHNDLLPIEDLIFGVKKIISENGIFSLILPSEIAQNLIKMCASQQLHLVRWTEVKPKSKKLANRYLMEFSAKESLMKKDELIIYNDLGTDYTSEYKNLTREFYLKF